MLSVSSIIRLRSGWLIMLSCFYFLASAQINSPYSRYGLGDIYHSGNVVNKAMGGISAPYADYQSVNFLNPAAYSRISLTTFDIGTEIESRNIQNSTKTDKYQSANFTFNYLAIGLPLNKKGTWGAALGIRPATKINYSIEQRERLSTSPSYSDSALTLYQGNGGSYKAFIGMGRSFGNLSIGVNAGWHFGQAELNTRRIFINDTVAYYKSNSATNTSFASFFAETGLQYNGRIGKNGFFRLGATYALKHSLKASQDIIRETFTYDIISGSPVQIDSVYKVSGIKGNIQFPQSYTAGIVFGKTDTFTKAEKWMIGIEYDAQSWSNYRFYDKKDLVANSYFIRIGGQFTPNVISNRFFSRLTYRAGFYFGKDYLNLRNTQLPVYAITFGAGIPLKRRSFYTNQFTTVNVGFEIGKRGNASVPVMESMFKLHVGLSLSDIWFNRQKYN